MQSRSVKASVNVNANVNATVNVIVRKKYNNCEHQDTQRIPVVDKLIQCILTYNRISTSTCINSPYAKTNDSREIDRYLQVG